MLPPTDSLVKEYGPMVSAIARRMIRDHHAAEDAAQEVWFEVLKSLPSFQGKSRLGTWIFTIAKRVILRYAHQEKVYTTRFLHGYFAGETREFGKTKELDHPLWVKEMCDQCLTGILHCLDNEARLSYILRDVIELSYAEIAGIMDKEPAAIRQDLSRTRKKLKNFLNRECILFNPASPCHCRMAAHVRQINLASEYEKIRKTAKQVRLFKEAETILPQKNFWEKFL